MRILTFLIIIFPCLSWSTNVGLRDKANIERTLSELLGSGEAFDEHAGKAGPVISLLTWNSDGSLMLTGSPGHSQVGSVGFSKSGDFQNVNSGSSVFSGSNINNTVGIGNSASEFFSTDGQAGGVSGNYSNKRDSSNTDAAILASFTLKGLNASQDPSLTNQSSEELDNQNKNKPSSTQTPSSSFNKQTLIASSSPQLSPRQTADLVDAFTDIKLPAISTGDAGVSAGDQNNHNSVSTANTVTAGPSSVPAAIAGDTSPSHSSSNSNATADSHTDIERTDAPSASKANVATTETAPKADVAKPSNADNSNLDSNTPKSTDKVYAYREKAPDFSSNSGKDLGPPYEVDQPLKFSDLFKHQTPYKLEIDEPLKAHVDDQEAPSKLELGQPTSPSRNRLFQNFAANRSSELAATPSLLEPASSLTKNNLNYSSDNSYNSLSNHSKCLTAIYNWNDKYHKNFDFVNGSSSGNKLCFKSKKPGENLNQLEDIQVGCNQLVLSLTEDKGAPNCFDFVEKGKVVDLVDGKWASRSYPNQSVQKKYDELSDLLKDALKNPNKNSKNNQDKVKGMLCDLRGQSFQVNFSKFLKPRDDSNYGGKYCYEIPTRKLNKSHNEISEEVKGLAIDCSSFVDKKNGLLNGYSIGPNDGQKGEYCINLKSTSSVESTLQDEYKKLSSRLGASIKSQENTSELNSAIKDNH